MIDLSHINVALIVEWCLLREAPAPTSVYCGATDSQWKMHRVGSPVNSVCNCSVELQKAPRWPPGEVNSRESAKVEFLFGFFTFCCNHMELQNFFFFQNAFDACRHCSSRSYCVTTVTWERMVTAKDLKNFLHSKEYLIMVALIFSARYLNENSFF